MMQRKISKKEGAFFGRAIQANGMLHRLSIDAKFTLDTNINFFLFFDNALTDHFMVHLFDPESSIDELPTSVCSLIHLKSLCLDNNNLKQIPPSLLKECKTLQNISLHGKSHIYGSVSTGLRKTGTKVFRGVCSVALWLIWKWRNAAYLSSPESREAIITSDPFAQIQKLALLWNSHRLKQVFFCSLGCFLYDLRLGDLVSCFFGQLCLIKS
ncbi:plant intracellular Ras-group-related LRR protein 7 [Tanacetum coccineum]